MENFIFCAVYENLTTTTTCNYATLEAEIRNGVGWIPVGSNSLSKNVLAKKLGFFASMKVL